MDEVGKEGQNQVPGSLSAEQQASRLVGSTPANNQQRWMFRLTTREGPEESAIARRAAGFDIVQSQVHQALE